MRVEGWERLLAQHVADAENRRFCWGEHDCALWCAEWILKATGRDYVSEWRGKYSSEDELKSLLRKRLYFDIEGIADVHFEPVPLAKAQRGDILLHPSGAAGICTGINGVFVVEKGVIRERLMRCVKAWRVD